LSYTIDSYKKKLTPTKDFLAFSAFVCFFPQLVAGPIERASNLLPQFYKKRSFDYAKVVDGMRQILWGLFKKIVIADNCAQFANQIFNNSNEYSGSTLLLGAIFFTFQIYGDFSGYSDIAIGTSRLLGFNLKQNFAYPFFSRDIAEFWRRWHISLSTWFRDYVYIPLGGSRNGNIKSIRNTFVVFILSGFWHGANWTFIAWGTLNALYFLPLLLTGKNRVHLGNVAEGRILPGFKESTLILSTFILTTFAWIFFRADSVSHALSYIGSIFSYTIFEVPEILSQGRAVTTLFFILLFVVIEWLGRDNQYAIAAVDTRLNGISRYILYYVILFMIFRFGGEEQQFIYFQF
jgi:D-alanyl-lipoteichoic acid acyltransferase DltB (MBOAT superfamily)